MKKVLKPVLITLIILVALTAGVMYFLSSGERSSDAFNQRIAAEQSDQSDERAYRYDMDQSAVELKTSGEDKNVLNFNSQDVYQVKTSTAARERLDRVIRKTTAGFTDPIIAANPFGTNPNTFYFYFSTSFRGMIRYTVTVEDESVPDHVRYVNNGKEKNLSQTHEFVVSGLVQGKTNYIVMEVLDSTGAQREKRIYKYDVPASSVSAKLTVQEGRSKEKCRNGLFFLFPKKDKNIYVYDNSGMLRDTIQTESAHGGRIYQSGDSVLYQVSDTKVAKVSALGRVTGTAEVRGYGKIRDFSYDGYDNIYSLVTKKKKDYLLATSFQTGQTKVVISFPKGVQAGSLTAPAGGNAYAACSKPMGIVKIEALTGQTPKVSMVLGKKSAWKKTSWKKKVVEDENVVRWNMADSTLNLLPGQSDGMNDHITAYLSDNGKGTGIQFIVDGKGKSVRVLHSFPVGQGGKCGCENYDGHFLITNCDRGVYEEYDGTGKVTRQFSAGQPVDAVTKLSLNGMCFYGGN